LKANIINRLSVFILPGIYMLDMLSNVSPLLFACLAALPLTVSGVVLDPGPRAINIVNQVAYWDALEYMDTTIPPLKNLQQGVGSQLEIP
jgi:hypothetical protein